MKKSDYIFNMTNLIVNRVKFHAPQCAENVDLNRLKDSGIDLSLPIFFYEHKLTKLMSKCFFLAQKQVDFNLIFPFSQPYSRKLKCLVSTDADLKKFNINYRTKSDFVAAKNEKYIKINGQKIGQNLLNFFYDGFVEHDGANCFVRECMLSGRNIFLEFLNTTKHEKTINFEINLPLKSGYYCFKKLHHAISVTRILSGERLFFNFSSAQNFAFSCVDGVENSTCARINFSASVTLKPYQKRHFFYNFGSEKFMLQSMEEIEAFFTQSKKKNCEIFDVKIDTKIKNIDSKINYILPEKIYLAWLDGRCDTGSESEYLKLKNRFVLKASSDFVLNETDKINSIKIFNGNIYREVLVIKNFDEKAIEDLARSKQKKLTNFVISRRSLSEKNTPICYV